MHPGGALVRRPELLLGRHRYTPPMYFRLLTEADVVALLSIDELIEAMKGALRQFSTGKVEQPVRSVLPIGGGRSFFGVMPASVHEPRAVGAKLVTVFPGNAALELPTHLATILLFSAETGALVAMMDGRYVTEARTAAVSAVSAVLLARDETETMAIIGSACRHAVTSPRWRRCSICARSASGALRLNTSVTSSTR